MSILYRAMVSATVLASVHAQSIEAPPEPALAATAASARSRPRIAFVENRGQWDPRASFVARMGALTAWLEDRGWVFTLVEPIAPGPGHDPSTLGRRDRDPAPPALRGVAVRMRFVGGNALPEREPEERQPGHHNYFLGNDPAQWRSAVSLYTSVRYRGMYPGIDLRLRESGGTLEYDLLLEPGADLARVQVQVEGAQRLRLAEDGALVLETPLGPVVQPPPTTWQVDRAGRQHAIACRYVLLAGDRFGFLAPERDRDWSLVVDPKLVYSSYLGGNSWDYVADVDVDATGRTLVVGRTESLDYPTTPGAFRTAVNGVAWDGFVTLMNAAGTALVYSTFLGGDDQEAVFAGRLDANGFAWLAGSTRSMNFPTTPGAYDTTHNGTRDAFHARLDPTGSALLYSTLLGAAAEDAAYGIHVEAVGQVATICGQAGAAFPTTPNAYAPTYGGGPYDGFVARIDPSQPGAQQLVYSTYLGGPLEDAAWLPTGDATGVLTILGGTNSSTFPTTPGAYQPQLRGGWDGFLCQLDPSRLPAQQLVWSTFLGGTLDDEAWSFAVGPHGVTVGGTTAGGGFPTTPGSYSPNFNGGPTDAFVARLSLDGARLLWSTFLGASAGDEASDLWVDSLGITTVVGWTQTPGLFPTTPGALKRVRGGNQGFVTRIDPSGSRLLYSTYLGGSHHEGAWYVVADQAGVATVTGASTSPDFPTTPGAYDTTRNDPPYNAYDAYITRLMTVPAGVRRYGDVSRDCQGRKPTLHALDDALAGSTAFGLASSQAAPNAVSLLLLSLGPTTGISVLGLQIFVDPGALPVILAVSSNATGEAETVLPIPAQTSGRLFVQYVVVDLTGCPQTLLSATDALEINW